MASATHHGDGEDGDELPPSARPHCAGGRRRRAGFVPPGTQEREQEDPEAGEGGGDAPEKPEVDHPLWGPHQLHVEGVSLGRDQPAVGEAVDQHRLVAVEAPPEVVGLAEHEPEGGAGLRACHLQPELPRAVVEHPHSRGGRGRRWDHRGR